MKISDLTQLNA